MYGILYSYFAVKDDMRQKDGSGDAKEGKNFQDFNTHTCQLSLINTDCPYFDSPPPPPPQSFLGDAKEGKYFQDFNTHTCQLYLINTDCPYFDSPPPPPPQKNKIKERFYHVPLFLQKCVWSNA